MAQEQNELCIFRDHSFILRKRSWKIAVNALLDDGSTKIILTVMVQQNYIFKVKQKLCSFNWSHIDSIAKRAMQVFTANFVTVNLRLSQNVLANKWSNLKKIRFPNLGPRSIMDFLVEADYADLHCAKIEIEGEPHCW